MKGRKPKVLDNRKVQIAFANCDRLTAAKTEYAFIDDIFRGASCLDIGGNRTPIPVDTLFRVIKSLPEISSANIQKLLGTSQSYSRKIASVCRVITKECEKEFTKRDISRLERVNSNEGGINLLQAAIDRSEYLAWRACSKYYASVEVPPAAVTTADNITGLDFVHESESLDFA